MSGPGSTNIRHRLKSAASPATRLIARLLPIDLGRGRKLKRKLAFLLRSQWFSREWHLQNQHKELASLVSFAGENFPFYRELFSRCGIEGNRIRSLDDLRRIPVISRREIEANLEARASGDDVGGSGVLKSPWFSLSSTRFPMDEQAAVMEEALLLRHWENCGYKMGRPAVHVVNDAGTADDDSVNCEASHNWHRFFIAGLGDRNLGELCHGIKAVGAEFIFGQPGSLELLADSILQWGIELTFQGVITGWELLTDQVRGKLEKAFNAKVYDWYGLSFPSAAMGQCHYCEGYHLFSEQGILEIVDAQGNPVSTKGETGRVVITNFSNRALPLIRYDTGDMAVFSGEECRCGRGLPQPAGRIVGRSRDMLIGHDGRYLEPSIFHALFSGLGMAAANYSLIQTGQDRFSVTLVTGPRGRDEMVDSLKKMLTELIGGRPSIEFDFAERIESREGKTRPVERRMDTSTRSASAVAV